MSSANAIKELREKTGAGMLDCKVALGESGGDFNLALEYLRKKGMASADKKSSRLASEGLVQVHATGDAVALVEVNCETDFVAKNEGFQQFIAAVARHVATQKPRDQAELLTQKLEGQSEDIATATKSLVAKIGENIAIRRFACLTASGDERLGSYTHMGSRIAVIVKVKGAQIGPDALKDLAMHIAAAAPRYLEAGDIPEEVRAKEREIYEAQMQDSGKSSDILAKIIDGKLAKFASENSLVDQIYIKDPVGKQKINAWIKTLDPQAKIVEFVRYQVGEGMEKRENDFAAEVAKQLGK